MTHSPFLTQLQKLVKLYLKVWSFRKIVKEKFYSSVQDNSLNFEHLIILVLFVMRSSQQH